MTVYHFRRIKRENWRDRQEPDHKEPLIPEFKETLKPCSAISTSLLEVEHSSRAVLPRTAPFCSLWELGLSSYLELSLSKAHAFDE